jgi:3',5'-cyclic AMP phosphodiesterase CpdA
MLRAFRECVRSWAGALVAAAACATMPQVVAHDGQHAPVEKVPDAVAHRPTAIPDRVILTWTAEPARSQAVSWRTDASVGSALAQIALADGGPNFITRAREIAALTTPLQTDLGVAHFHSAEFTGLDPDTIYAYRVGDGVNWSEWFHFRTAKEGPAPFKFIYFGDAQNDIKSLWSRVIRGAYSDASKARFIIHAGDLVNNGDTDAQWGEWFAAGGWVNGMISSIPSPGNHEYPRDSRAEGSPRHLSRHWRPQFALPLNGPPGLEETVYFIDFQGVRIVSLNSNEQQALQARWLDAVLSENPNRWTILTFHHPIYSAAKDRDNPALRRLWQPVIARHRVDLVLQGHDHTYARSGLIGTENTATGAGARDPEGTIYVVSVSGPKMYNLARAPWMQRVAEDTQLYQVIAIDGDTLTYEARTATGDLYDAFELTKGAPGAPNLFVDKSAGIPERIRPGNRLRKANPAPAVAK